MPLRGPERPAQAPPAAPVSPPPAAEIFAEPVLRGPRIGATITHVPQPWDEPEPASPEPPPQERPEPRNLNPLFEGSGIGYRLTPSQPLMSLTSDLVKLFSRKPGANPTASKRPAAPAPEPEPDSPPPPPVWG
jgi:hypothetical protein